MQQHLEESALRVLTLFAGADNSIKMPNGQPVGGFQAIAAFIDHSVPKGEQEKAAGLLLRMLEGSTWDLWQLSREQIGEPDAQPNADASRFIQSSINAISDSFLYGSPVYLQLDSFKQVQASVFQLTRAPGKKVVYLGSLLLVLGIFSMFYVRERRLWFWLKDTRARHECRDGHVERAQDARFRERIRSDARRGRRRAGRKAHRSIRRRQRLIRQRRQRRPPAHKIRPGKIMDLTQVSSSSLILAAAKSAQRAKRSTSAQYDERPFLKRLGIVDWLFALAMVAGAGFALSRYHPFMNYYDKLVLCCAVPVFVVLGWRWKPVRPLMVGHCGAVAARHPDLSRRSDPRGQRLLPQIFPVEPVRDSVDERAVRVRHGVLLDRPAVALADRRRDRLEDDVGRRGDGLYRPDGALVRVLPDRRGRRPYSHLEPVRSVRAVQPDHRAVLSVLRAALQHARSSARSCCW